MTKLSVNINKIALIRNARGSNLPDIIKIALDCERFGAQGITVHPRPDERHIRYKDLTDLKPLLKTEFNIEGYPTEKFIEIVCSVNPAQVTLVPDAPDAITSNAGWDIIKNKSFLKDVVKEFKSNGIRTSLFVDPDIKQVDATPDTGTDRIEFYTENYAKEFPGNKETALKPYYDAAKVAVSLGLGINAGHDLNLDNLKYFAENIPELLEVSIGHALVCDALYIGLENTIQLYLRQLK